MNLSDIDVLEKPTPYFYGAYFDLLEAVIADNVPYALACVHALSAISHETPSLIRSWADLCDAEQACLLRQVNGDASTQVFLRSPSLQTYQRSRNAMESALELLREIAPKCHDEIKALVRSLILVAGNVNEAEEFDGATAFGAWGALFLNADHHLSRIEAVEGLVHETAHAVLLGRSQGRSFVENSPAEVYPSPLRSDLRPLDGTYHATFVSARMCYALRVVAASGRLTSEESEMASQSLVSAEVAYNEGLSTVRRFAKLTPLGASIITSTDEYMRSAG